MVSWSEVCWNKDEGGLGFRKSKLMNEALLMKLAFAILKNEDALWVKVICNKYKCGNLGVPEAIFEPY